MSQSMDFFGLDPAKLPADAARALKALHFQQYDHVSGQWVSKPFSVQFTRRPRVRQWLNIIRKKKGG